MPVTRLVALRGGEPLSVTTTEKAFVLGPEVSEVGQVISPEEAPMLRPAGAESTVKERVWPGSGSDAGRVSERVWFSSMVTFVAAMMTGGELVRLTKVWASGCSG